jgi:hypothetical protein
MAFLVCQRLRRGLRRGAGCTFGGGIGHCMGFCGDWNASELFVVWIWQICVIIVLFAVVMFNRLFRDCIR